MIDTKEIIEKNISIILQGPINSDNIFDILKNCRSWRNILPKSEIILSISSIKYFKFDSISKLHIDPSIEFNDFLKNSAHEINTLCDHIILTENCEKLPKIKKDSNGSNNINYQIKSSFNGVRVATKKYALKIRSDMLFINTDFIQFYIDNFSLERKAHKCLQQRILISSIYTINPFSKERMPFHFSDWFQFGLLCDLKRVWDVNGPTLEDATFYINNAYSNHSNKAEKLFLTRIAVEQHITYNLASKFFPDLFLDYHNDLRSVEKSIDFLLDNFLIINANEDCIVFDKYKKNIKDYNNLSKCISYEEWLFMVKNRDIKYKNYLCKNKELLYLTFGPEDLFCKDSIISEKNIVNKYRNGILSYGPYIDLNKGFYFFDICFEQINGLGYFDIKVTSNCGENTIYFSRNFNFIHKKNIKKTISIEVINYIEKDLEIIIFYKNLKNIKLSRLIIHN